MSSPPPPDSDFEIAGHRVQPRLNRIVADDRTHQVEPKIMDVLVRLAESPGEPVSRDDLLDDVWNGAFVTDDVLTRSIVELRKIFDDDPRDPRVIETIRKVGYRLVAPVDPVGQEDGSRAPAARSGAPTSGRPASGAVAAPSGSTADAESAGVERTGLLAGAAAVLSLVVVAALWSLGYLHAGSETLGSPRAVIPLTTHIGNEFDPALSPDGDALAFAWSGRAGHNLDIWLQPVGGSPRRLTRHPDLDHEPAWSPDGERVAFVRESSSDCAVFVAPADGGSERRLTSCDVRHPLSMAWSPDGEWLALTRGTGDSGRPWRLALVAVDGSRIRHLTSPPADVLGDHEPAFSPAGDRVAFVRAAASGVADVHVVPVEGGTVRRLTRDHRDVVGLDWTGDGDWIVFGSDRKGGYSLWRVPARGGEPEWVAGGAWKLKHPSVARGRNAVAYESWLYVINVWTTRRLGDGDWEASPTIASTQWDFEPAYSPSGDRIAFVSTRSGNYEIWIAGRDGEDPVRLTRLEGPLLRTPRWSPDGRRLAFVAYIRGHADLFVVDAAGGSPRRLTADRGDEVAPSWSRDGRRVYFASRRTGAWQVWRVPSGGGDPAQVTPDGGYAAVESPDGETLLYTRVAESGIFARPVRGGPSRRLLDEPGPGDRLHWGTVDRGIFYLARPDSGVPVVRYVPWSTLEGASGAVPGSGSEDLAELAEFVGRGLAVAPDRSRVLFARRDRHESDIVMLEGIP